MSRRHVQEDRELQKIRAQEEALIRRELEFSENQRRLAMERSERERTMPPLEDLTDRANMSRHEQVLWRGDVVNMRREQNSSLLLLMLLTLATCALVWWGLQLMRG